ncbi:MAG: ThuA domain-containing protein [Kiritimatiellae bacterium]|nr:ThuA domain-containing protein [Kiritimatiellia bacterium]
MHHPKITKRCAYLLLLTLVGLGTAQAADKTKVLYFTHEPGRWHDYTTQKAKFSQIAEDAGWDLTVQTGEHHAQMAWLHTEDYSKGYDVLVYNFCFANDTDLEASNNLITQTRDNGVPAVLIHCAMHSWWPTYKSGDSVIDGAHPTAKSNKGMIDKWKAAHADTPYPVWGDFTGVASVRHGPQKPITITKTKDHPITKRLPEGFTTKNTELYNNHYVTDTVEALANGKQGDATAIVLWLNPQGKSQVMGLSVGHGTSDWEAEAFQHLLIDGINFLAEEK